MPPVSPPPEARRCSSSACDRIHDLQFAAGGPAAWRRRQVGRSADDSGSRTGHGREQTRSFAFYVRSRRRCFRRAGAAPVCAQLARAVSPGRPARPVRLWGYGLPARSTFACSNPIARGAPRQTGSGRNRGARVQKFTAIVNCQDLQRRDDQFQRVVRRLSSSRTTSRVSTCWSTSRVGTARR